MSIEMQCDCGKLLRVAEKNAGRRLKCPACERELTVPQSPDPAPNPVSPFLLDSDAEGSTSLTGLRVTGRAASVRLGTMNAWMFGTASLSLTDGRVIQQSSGLLTRTHVIIPLSQVDSVETISAPSPLLLVLGLLTLSLFGLGLIFLGMYFFIRAKFLLVYSRSNVAIIAMRGTEQPYHDFKEAVLKEAESLRQRRSL